MPANQWGRKTEQKDDSISRMWMSTQGVRKSPSVWVAVKGSINWLESLNSYLG